MKHLQALLQGKCTSHILPFLWMKGEDNETIGKELDKIEKCGIREVCLESRPHPDFCGPKWWENLDFICAEAENENTFSEVLDYMRANNITLVGAVHDFSCPVNGKNYMFFPIRII